MKKIKQKKVLPVESIFEANRGIGIFLTEIEKRTELIEKFLENKKLEGVTAQAARILLGNLENCHKKHKKSAETLSSFLKENIKQ